jgi:hypothetical protein
LLARPERLELPTYRFEVRRNAVYRDPPRLLMIDSVRPFVYCVSPQPPKLIPLAVKLAVKIMCYDGRLERDTTRPILDLQSFPTSGREMTIVATG